MNFFEHQDQARRNTAYLICLFGVAIASMIVALYLTSLLVEVKVTNGLSTLWHPERLLVMSLGVGSIVGFGSLQKTMALRSGGSNVAVGMGGQLVSQDTNSPQERQLLNVVEEMAIASGISVPQVYLLSHERGINAFAAGYSPNDAVIGITQGCLDILDRDELQGVIGHEFSHILNGDMRLNIKLMGVLHGILMVHIMGRTILRYGGRSRNRDRKGGGIFAFALAMLIIGGIGWVCGRLIKSAVSRQREFLADASAVQFTRNADGIGNALRKIAGHTVGAQVTSPKAEEASHMFFGDIAGPKNIWTSFSNAFATHPPLPERIRRITGRATSLNTAGNTAGKSRTGNLGLGTAALSAQAAGVMGFQSTATAVPPSATSPPEVTETETTPQQLVTEIGSVAPGHLDYAHDVIASLPENIREQIHQSTGALATAYGLFLDRQKELRIKQISLLKKAAAPEVVATLATLYPTLAQLPSRHQLPVLELCIPALRTLTTEAASTFFKTVQALVRADQRLSLTEYSLQIILQHRLRPHFSKKGQPDKLYRKPEEIWDDSLQVISALARVGHTSPKDIDYAFREGLYKVPGAKRQTLPAKVPQGNLYDVGKSLKVLSQAAPKLKQGIVDACAHTVLVDQKVTDAEAQLLRAMIIALDCPVPPFLKA